MEDITKAIAIAIVIIMAGIAIAFIVEESIENSEKNECRRWQSDSKKFEGWYSVDWQKEQCASYNINLIK